MRYFKRIEETNRKYIQGKIFPETFKGKGLITVKESVNKYKSYWQEVSEEEYLLQENKEINYEIY